VHSQDDRVRFSTRPRTKSDREAETRSFRIPSSLERYFLGHPLYEISVRIEGRDLPIAIRLDPGNDCDLVWSRETPDPVVKPWREADQPWRVQDSDAGHDADPIYGYFVNCGALFRVS
jgi:hypothetical protein